MIQANDLPLCEVLDSSLIAEAFQEDGVSFGNADEDVFTPAITLWAMASQFLFKATGRSCKAAAGRVVSLWAQVAGRVVTQTKYPQNPAQKEGLGFPIIRCVCLISMITGMLVDLGYAAYSGKGTGETAILHQLRNSLRRGDILVADSYHCTYWLVAMCMDLGVHVVMKNHHKRDDDPIGATRFSDTERTIKWVRSARPKWMSKTEYRKVPKLIKMRLSDVVFNQAGSRCKAFTVATTMLDRDACPGTWLGSIYEGRWMVEPDIEAIKCTMGLEHLRGRSPESLEREIWTGILTYNLVRLKMLQSGDAAGREIRSMSFTETYQLLSTNWLLCACVGVSGTIAVAAQRQGVCAIVGHRPDRSEPRENKRRPKVLKLMTVPRRLYNAAMAAFQKIS
jgi:hypothetical protein